MLKPSQTACAASSSAAHPSIDIGLHATGAALFVWEAAKAMNEGILVLIALAPAGYEQFYRAVGGIWCSRLGMITFMLAAILVPIASLLPNSHAAVLPELFLAMAVNSAADMAAYSGSNVLVSPLSQIPRLFRLFKRGHQTAAAP